MDFPSFSKQNQEDTFLIIFDVFSSVLIRLTSYFKKFSYDHLNLSIFILPCQKSLSSPICHFLFLAGGENRTHVGGLQNHCFTIKLLQQIIVTYLWWLFLCRPSNYHLLFFSCIFLSIFEANLRFYSLSLKLKF